MKQTFKQTMKQLTAIAALSFTLSFFTGLSASLIYQEHRSIQTIIAAQEEAGEGGETLFADAEDAAAKTIAF